MSAISARLSVRVRIGFYAADEAAHATLLLCCALALPPHPALTIGEIMERLQRLRSRTCATSHQVQLFATLAGPSVYVQRGYCRILRRTHSRHRFKLSSVVSDISRLPRIAPGMRKAPRLRLSASQGPDGREAAEARLFELTAKLVCAPTPLEHSLCKRLKITNCYLRRQSVLPRPQTRRCAAAGDCRDVPILVAARSSHPRARLVHSPQSETLSSLST